MRVLKYLMLIAALAVSACTMPAFNPAQAPAPLAATTIDDKALETAWKAFDLSLDAINTLGDLGVIVPGTARGKAVASAIRKVNTALSAAERFAAAGSSTEYVTALGEAAAGIRELSTLIRSN